MRRHWLLCLVLTCVLSLQACASASDVNFIPDGPSYTADGLAGELDAVEPGPAAKVTYEDAPAIRQDALADLRRNGADAAALADELTTNFPADAAAVPFRVERATYEAEAVWVVYEAWGEPGGTLDHRRVWVFAVDSMEMRAALSTD